jgi:hypothetical protein
MLGTASLFLAIKIIYYTISQIKQLLTYKMLLQKEN